MSDDKKPEESLANPPEKTFLDKVQDFFVGVPDKAADLFKKENLLNTAIFAATGAGALYVGGEALGLGGALGTAGTLVVGALSGMAVTALSGLNVNDISIGKKAEQEVKPPVTPPEKQQNIVNAALLGGMAVVPPPPTPVVPSKEAGKRTK